MPVPATNAYAIIIFGSLEKNGMMEPTATSKEHAITGILRLPILSEIGPAITVMAMAVTIMHMEITET